MMNDLTLRINGGSVLRTKKSIAVQPVIITKNFSNTCTDTVAKFNGSDGADDQLAVLKNIFDKNIDQPCSEIMRFLAVVFLQTEAKHPVKSFITRNINKNNGLQSEFTEALAAEITLIMNSTDYKEYVDTVSKLAPCIENFPPGAAAMKKLEIPLTEYLINCLKCCIDLLRQNSLSPTEKNEVYALSHLDLRLILHNVQKIDSDNTIKLSAKFECIKSCIQKLLFDDDAPMDTKSVCGILYLTMHLLENGSDSWKNIFLEADTQTPLNTLLQNKAAQLAFYSAVTTVVPINNLQETIKDGITGIEISVKKILEIGERCCTEAVFILGVARTILALSKGLTRVTAPALGERLVADILSFVWGHLEHHMDSVRHLSAQALTCVVRYCLKLEEQGVSRALNDVFSTLSALEGHKSYYVGISCACGATGAGAVLRALPDAPRRLLAALHDQPHLASATTALEMLIQSHSKEASTESVYAQCVLPVLQHAASCVLDASVAGVLEGLLARAVRLDPRMMDYILPHIQLSCESRDMRYALMLVSVARAGPAAAPLGGQGGAGGLETPETEWKGIISYDMLRRAAIDEDDETRILVLSLVAESPKSAAALSSGELELAAHFLQYNLNAQSPSFRQQMLALFIKLLKRLEASYKPGAGSAHYREFVSGVRSVCFRSLLRGANYGRRSVALQLLALCEQLHLPGYQTSWSMDYVEKLIQHLEDSYENNKALALETLTSCPVELLELGSKAASLSLADVLRQANEMKPTECVSAAYKLRLLRRRLPGHILRGEECTAACPVDFVLLRTLLGALRGSLAARAQGVAAARAAPVYGVLHCMGQLAALLDADAMSSDDSWRQLVAEVVVTCVSVTECAALVVNSAAPEGHLPMDASPAADHGCQSGIAGATADGRPVTAQMVLLCAWRSVKEVSLLLGTLCGRLHVQGEAPAWTLSVQQVEAAGALFMDLLTHTQHRGAFEQAYVGFSSLLARLWRCRSAALHALPAEWLRTALQALTEPAGPEGGPEGGPAEGPNVSAATRRSAGVPFMIQALVTTEVQVSSNPRCFHQCMRALLSTARLAPDPVRRAHCLHVLRAVFRHAALQAAARGYVEAGLRAALRGFDGGTWTERNSSTLLFAALASRVFGPQRARSRGDMTGRIFFLNYPSLYDVLLASLQSERARAPGALYPALALLGRLQPSALEGTASSLALAAFVPAVLRCARSPVLRTRELAARAAVPLIPPDTLIDHIESIFSLLADPNIPRNFCHGLLLQLSRLLEGRGAGQAAGRGPRGAGPTVWVAAQAAGELPCYLIADEYVRMMNFLLLRFPGLLEDETVDNLIKSFELILFQGETPTITSGREVCSANCMYLYLILLHKYRTPEDAAALVCKGLQHGSYEVVLSVLNYILVANDKGNLENKFQNHLNSIKNELVLNLLKANPNYTEQLCDVLRRNRYSECRQKCLEVLVLQTNTQRHVIGEERRDVTDQAVLEQLVHLVENCHDKLTHIYLQSLLHLVADRLPGWRLGGDLMLRVVRLLFECSSADSGQSARAAVGGFLDAHLGALLELDLEDCSEADRFELRTTLLGCLAALLEDDEPAVRRAAGSAARHCGCPAQVVGSVSAEGVRRYARGSRHAAAALLALALLDFRSEVCVTDEISDECRVFDQSERYNVHLEESVWTAECAELLLQLYEPDEQLVGHVAQLVQHPLYSRTFRNLCHVHVTTFNKIIKDGPPPGHEAVNPKVELFIQKITRKQDWC